MKVTDRGLSLTAILIGIAGLMAAYYFYRQSVLERTPTFLVDPVRATIIDSSGPRLSDLSVLYHGKPVGDRSVTAVRVYFWNSGRMPIRRSDVLRPVECVLPTDSEILDFRVLKSSRDITGIALSAAAGNPGNRLEVGFDIPEKDDGAALQIIYAGPQDAAIHFEGVIVGAAQPTLKAVRAPRSSEQAFERLNRIIGWGGMLLGALLVGVAVFLRLRGRSSTGPSAKDHGEDALVRLIIPRGTKRPVALLVASCVYIVLGAFVTFYHPRLLSDVPRTIVVEKW